MTQSELALTDCVEWQGHRNYAGYGLKKVNKRWRKAHRLAWESAYGPIPQGLCVCHKCDNPCCVNVNHLFLGTQKDNFDDMVAKGRARFVTSIPKSHCCHGHPMSGPNLGIKKSGRRYCRSCDNSRRRVDVAREKRDRDNAARRAKRARLNALKGA